MRTTILALILFGLICPSWAQTDSLRITNIEAKLDSAIGSISSLKRGLNRLESSTSKISKNINRLSNEDQAISLRLDSALNLLTEQKKSIDQLSSSMKNQKKELSGQIQQTNESASRKIASLDESLSKNTLYWIIAVLAVAFIALGLFLMLRKRVSDNQLSMIDNLSATRKQLELEGIKLDEKLIGVMETQLKVIQEEKASSGNSPEPDHSLALKVADEIVRIEKNISQMDEGTKGLKQLSKAVERIRDNFAANGYEMVDMLGKEFDNGMKVTANFRPDENLAAGERIITRIIKPQVNFKEVMIQSAQIEVSQGD